MGSKWKLWQVFGLYFKSASLWTGININENKEYSLKFKECSLQNKEYSLKFKEYSLNFNLGNIPYMQALK